MACLHQTTCEKQRCEQKTTKQTLNKETALQSQKKDGREVRDKVLDVHYIQAPEYEFNDFAEEYTTRVHRKPHAIEPTSSRKTDLHQREIDQ